MRKAFRKRLLLTYYMFCFDLTPRRVYVPKNPFFKPDALVGFAIPLLELPLWLLGLGSFLATLHDLVEKAQV